MAKVLDRILAVIARADQHIHDFQLGVAAFHANDPYGVAVKEDTNAGKRIYYVSWVKDIPDSLAPIAANVIQDLRSPLDQIAYQLVIATLPSGTEPASKIYYPIRDEAAHYPSAIGPIKKYVRPEVVDAINATEPWKGGKGHALWQLNALNNPHKHQVPLLASSYLASVDLAAGFAEMFREMGIEDISIPPAFFKPADNLMPLKMGDELYIEPLFKPEPLILSPADAVRLDQQGRIRTHMEKDRQFSFDVAINQPGIVDGQPALKTLRDYANLVRDIVTRLGQFLP